MQFTYISKSVLFVQNYSLFHRLCRQFSVKLTPRPAEWQSRSWTNQH